MVAAAVNVKLNLIEVDPYRHEHQHPKFLKLNPHQTVPVLVDGNFVLFESRAICIYLVEKYAKEDSLYPRDAQKRAIVNQRLYFDMGTLFKRFAEFYYPQVLRKLRADSDKLMKLEEAMEILEKFLENSIHVAGDKMTVADISIVATINTCDFTGYDFSKHPNISRWYTLMKKNCPGWSANLRAAAMAKHDLVKISYKLDF